MNFKTGTFITLVLLSFLFTLSNCQKSRLNRDTTAAEDNNIAESSWDDVGDQVDGSVDLEESDSIPVWNNCATLRIDTLGSPFPILFTLDFGDHNCLCADGRYRKGSVIYELSGPYRLSGTSVKVMTDDYFIDNFKVIGTRTTTNLGKNTSDQPQFEVNITGAQIITPDGETISWESTRQRVWVEGNETGFFTEDTIYGGILGWEGLKDDVYSITGSATGTSREGRSFSANITSALKVKLNCAWITEGITELTPEGLTTRVIDYGDGGCDNQATVSIGRKNYTLTLHK